MPPIGTIIAQLRIDRIALATTAVLPPATATALPPSPPYNAFVLEGTDPFLLNGTRSYDATNSTIGALEFGAGFQTSVNSTVLNSNWGLVFMPPTLSSIVVGTTYSTS